MLAAQLISSLILLCATTTTLVACTKEIFLPPDADVVNIVGNGFSLQINQLNKIKDQWKDVSVESASIESPRDDSAPGQAQVSNENLFEQTIEKVGAKDYGSVDEELLDWISSRATALTDKIERYQEEVVPLKAEERLVVQTLLLNTIVDLENLVKENMAALKWIRKKLRLMQNLKSSHQSEVEAYLNSKIQANINIERKVKSTNKPPQDWLNNVALVKRILHEQRFSSDISKMLIAYLGGTFSMMERSTVFDLNRTNKNLNDGLYYVRAKGRVPAHFPFTAQEAIVNDA